jgi:hypothetical protein
MTAEATERTGVLVLRAWIEGDPSTGLRARITQAADNAAPEYLVATAATVEDVCAGVRAWLEELMARQVPQRPTLVR